MVTLVTSCVCGGLGRCQRSNALVVAPAGAVARTAPGTVPLSCANALPVGATSLLPSLFGTQIYGLYNIESQQICRLPVIQLLTIPDDCAIG